MTEVEKWKAARQRLGLNQIGMARALRVARGTYYKWESGIQKAPAVARAARQMLLHMQEKAPGALNEWLDESPLKPR